MINNANREQVKGIATFLPSNYGSDVDDKVQFDDLFQLFNLIKQDTPQNHIFYQHLFKNYQKFIFNFNHIKDGNNQIVYNIVSGRELLVNQIIDAQCFAAFNVLVKDYHYIPTEFNFQHAVKMGSTKFLNTIISSLNKPTPVEGTSISIDSQPTEQLLSPQQQSSATVSPIPTSTSTPTLIPTPVEGTLVSVDSQTTEQLLSQQQQQQQQSSATISPIPFEINKIIGILLKYKENCCSISFNSLWYLIKRNFIDLNAEENDDSNNIVLQYTRNIEINEYITVKALISISRVISLVTGGSGGGSQFDFTKEVKRMKLKHSSIQQPEIKKKIMNLLNTYYIYSGNERSISIQYYIFSDTETTNYNQQFEIVSSIPTIINRLKISFQFADLPLFRNCVDSIVQMPGEIDCIYSEFIKLVANSFVNSNDDDDDGDGAIFSHCNQLQKQNSFIHSILKEPFYGIGNSDTMDKIKQIIKPEIILFLLIGYNDTQLVEYFGSLLGILNSSPFIEFLDWMYLNHYNYLNANIYNKYPIEVQNLFSYNGISKLLLSKIGRFDNINLFARPCEIKEFNFEWEDLNLLGHILNQLKGQNLDGWPKELIFQVMEFSARSGRLRTFEQIFQYHNWVLKQPRPGGCVGLFSTDKLIKLLFLSLRNSHIDLAIFFFEILPNISIGEFVNNASDISKNYFISKLKFRPPKNQLMVLQHHQNLQN